MLGVLVAAVMAATFFLPWFEFFGEAIGPTMIFEDGIRWENMPWQGFGFLASFAIAALAALMALAGRAAGVLMLIAGAIPYGLIAHSVLGARDQLNEMGLPIPRGNNPTETFDMVREFIAIGAPLYFIAAALLVLIGLGRTVTGR